MKVIGNDVYISGHENMRDDGGVYNIARYWKNGEPVYLSDNSKGNSANSIHVLDNNVFVAGYYKGDNGYWVNGQFHPIDGYVTITGIFVVERKKINQ